MSVGVVVDSAASLPRELRQAWGITVVPLLLTVGGRTWPDGEVDLDEVLAANGEVSSSGPSPGHFAAAIETADAGDGVVVLTVARSMSSTFAAAQLAARAAAETVAVVDTRSAAGGEGLVALAAAERAASGAPLDEVVATAEAAAARVRLVATVPDLDHLARSGRVPDAAAMAGRWLHLNPLFEFIDGRPRPLRPARSRDAALERIVARWRASTPPAHGHLHVAALHARDVDAGRELLERVRAEVEPATAFLAPFSAVMVAHTGAGLAGLSWWWEPQSPGH